MTFGAMYSVYSLPNMILPLFGGILTDKYGDRFMSLIFCLLISLGQLIFAVGYFALRPWIMLTGRFIFGMGGESLNITMSTLIMKWFIGSELSFS